jgi:hypothetical protein
VEKSLADQKRTYTLKLFAGGEKAKELFASLAKELANIVNKRPRLDLALICRNEGRTGAEVLTQFVAY